jgi:hypothetical protein
MELRFKIYNLFELEKDISPTEKRSKRKFDIIQIILMGAGATFDWLFFDNSKVINFDD